MIFIVYNQQQLSFKKIDMWPSVQSSLSISLNQITKREWKWQIYGTFTYLQNVQCPQLLFTHIWVSLRHLLNCHLGGKEGPSELSLTFGTTHFLIKSMYCWTLISYRNRLKRSQWLQRCFDVDGWRDRETRGGRSPMKIHKQEKSAFSVKMPLLLIPS